MKTLISLFNLTHSGSRNLYDSLVPTLLEASHILIIDKSHQIPVNHKSKIYRVNYEASSVKWLKKHLIEQLFIPVICVINKVNKVILFGNLPVLFLSIPQVVFFHNLLYLEKFQKNLYQTINQYIFFYLTKLKKPALLVQTEYVKKKINLAFNLNKIDILKTSINQPNHSNTNIFSVASHQINLIYPSFNYPYKNHLFLIKNIKIFEKLNIHIWFTCKKIGNHRPSLNLHYLGEQSSNLIKSQYFFFDGIFNTSDFESLGMYLLEAVAYKIPVISCDKEYVYSAIENFYSFKHLCPSSLEMTLINFKDDYKNRNLMIPKSNLIDQPEKIVSKLLE